MRIEWSEPAVLDLEGIKEFRERFGILCYRIH